jgi:hypothetical protein
MPLSKDVKTKHRGKDLSSSSVLDMSKHHQKKCQQTSCQPGKRKLMKKAAPTLYFFESSHLDGLIQFISRLPVVNDFHLLKPKQNTSSIESAKQFISEKSVAILFRVG